MVKETKGVGKFRFGHDENPRMTICIEVELMD
jgi:hypothetical protein